jgi:hypothetical protein
MTEFREYRTVDKSTWGDGPWQDEPDKRQWQDAATGLPCLIVRNRRGALCGYVGVPATHPAHGLDHDADALGTVEVHGGLTFARGCGHGTDETVGICHVPAPGEPDDVWWFGFDCSHSGDASPAILARERARGWEEIEMPWGPDVYRDVAYVTTTCASLAAQLEDRIAHLRLTRPALVRRITRKTMSDV